MNYFIQKIISLSHASLSHSGPCGKQLFPYLLGLLLFSKVVFPVAFRAGTQFQAPNILSGRVINYKIRACVCAEKHFGSELFNYFVNEVEGNMKLFLEKIGMGGMKSNATI